VKILIVGATSVLGEAVSTVLGEEHDILRADRNGCDYQLDLSSESSIVELYENVGTLEAVVSTNSFTDLGGERLCFRTTTAAEVE